MDDMSTTNDIGSQNPEGTPNDMEETRRDAEALHEPAAADNSLTLFEAADMKDTVAPRDARAMDDTAAMNGKAHRGVMIVTGSGRGIGAAIAIAAGREGFSVCVNYSRSKFEALRVVDTIKASGSDAIAVQADVSIEADIVRMFEEVDNKLGKVTALINNAGVNYVTPFVDMDLAGLRRVISVNIEGTFVAAREAVRRMAHSQGGDGGVIINISSISSRSGGGPKDVIYASSKGMIDTFTMGLAKEFARDGVRVCSLRPGMSETDIFNSADGIEAARRVAADIVPMGRMAKPEEIASLALWLCSPSASYVTGLPFDVSGGR